MPQTTRWGICHPAAICRIVAARHALYTRPKQKSVYVMNVFRAGTDCPDGVAVMTAYSPLRPWLREQARHDDAYENYFIGLHPFPLNTYQAALRVDY